MADDGEESSMAGIVFGSHTGAPGTLLFHPIPGPISIHSVPNNSNLCSSSSGLILFLDVQHFYRIINPFHSRVTGYRKVPKNSDGIHIRTRAAVLSLDLSDPGHCIYYISCPIRINGFYRFHTCCSDTGWRLSSDAIPTGGPIIPGTAVSCGTTAFWLTGTRELVVYDPVNRSAPPCLELPDFELSFISRIQLGVVMGNRLGLVLVNAVSVALFLLEAEMDEWEPNPVAQLEVEMVDDTNGWNGSGDTGRIVCRDLPLPIRSESSRMQVLLSIDERLFMWEDLKDNENAGDGLLMVVNPIDHGQVLHEGNNYLDAVPLVYGVLEL